MGSQAESVMTLISFVVNYVKDSPKRLASFKVFQADGSSALKGIQNLLSEDNTLKDILPNYTMAVRILLVLPATSCTAERSFSCLRRLKSWLRSNMGEQRLTYLALLNINRELVDNIDLKKVVNGFVKGATVRENTFLHLK